MKRAERIIRQQINDLTVERIAPRKEELEQAIKFMYWEGKFNAKKYSLMLLLLNDKYTEVMNNYFEEEKKKADEDFKRLMQHYEADY